MIRALRELARSLLGLVLSGIGLWFAERAARLLTPPRVARLVGPVKFADDPRALALYERERELQRLLLADQVLGRAFGWRLNEVRQ